MSRVLVAVFVLVLLAGCGSGSSSSTTLTGHFGETALSITVWPQGKTGPRTTYTLNCRLGVGTLPEARAACSKLRRVGAAVFAPVPPGTACAEIYGGPQIARVSGRLAGEPIEADFKRTDGCEIARWGQLAFLFSLGS